MIISTVSLLSSCGSTPTQPPSSQTQQISFPQAIQALLTASSTPTSITITIVSSANASYILYMSDSINGKSDTAIKYTGNNTYTLILDPNKTYKFLLTQINPAGKETFTGSYIISKPSTNSISRDDMIQNPPLPPPEYNAPLPLASPAVGLSGFAYTPGSYLNIRYAVYTTKNGVRYVDNPVIASLHVVEASGKHCVENFHDADSLDFDGVIVPGGACVSDYRLHQHPETDWLYSGLPNPYSECPMPNWSAKSAYLYSLEGKWDKDNNWYSNSKATGTYEAGIMYIPEPQEIQEFWGPVKVEYTIGKGCNKIEKIPEKYLPPSPLSLADYYSVPHWKKLALKILIYADGSECGASMTPPSNVPVHINVIPPSATVYLHHTDPEKKRQHFSAVLFDNPGTIVTNQAEWSSDNPGSAKVNNDVVKGLSYATLLPGSAAITATLVQNGITAASSAELCVDCWEFTHYRQNEFSVPIGQNWVDEPFALNPTTGKARTTADLGRDYTKLGWLQYKGYEFSIANKGCYMVCAAMLLKLTTHDDTITPYTLNKWLQNNDGYKSDNSPDWDVIKQTYPNNRIAEVDPVPSWQYHPSTDQNSLDDILANCDAAIANVTGYMHPESHFVLIIKGKEGKYKIYDPWLIRDITGKPIESLVKIDDLDDPKRKLVFHKYKVFKFSQELKI